MPYRFDDIAGPAQQVIVNAMQQLIPAASRCTQSLNPGTTNWAPYHKWFDAKGETNPGNLTQVRNIVSGIQRALSDANITFANALGNKIDQAVPGLCAYVFTRGQFYQGHVGSGMRILIIPKANMREMMQTIYHELSHKVGNTRDINYNHTVCESFARTDPQSAINNAENYNMFLTEFM